MWLEDDVSSVVNPWRPRQGLVCRTRVVELALAGGCRVEPEGRFQSSQFQQALPHSGSENGQVRNDRAVELVSLSFSAMRQLADTVGQEKGTFFGAGHQTVGALVRTAVEERC
jgi:hypothetical protein